MISNLTQTIEIWQALVLFPFCLFVAYLIHRLGYFLAVLYVNYETMWKNNKEFKKRSKEVEEMKANGDLPEWVTLPIYGKDTHVCKKTGYCPSLECFINIDYIKTVLYMRARKAELAKLFNEGVVDLASKHGVDTAMVIAIAEGIDQIKENIGIKYEEKLKEFKGDSNV
ncbi:MAG TPA: hypothetical protein VI911_11505 [Patescibacteria group bacterium]|nr:hypothetical protein [Patescibacteria group bacterium]